MLSKNAKIHIAGHRGMVGSACWRALKSAGYSNLLGRTSKELDLRDQRAVNDFIQEERPEVIIDAAARVGGILANDTFRTEFLLENLKINMNILESITSKPKIKMIKSIQN